MGRRSKKLGDKSEAVKALFKYVKQHSGMTLIELEKRFSKCENGGRQWSRWQQGPVQPEINIVREVYFFACNKLICCEEKLEWTSLLPAVVEPKLSFLLEGSNMSTLLSILKQIEHPLVTLQLLSGIEAGYYLPSSQILYQIFWSTPDNNREEDDITWHRIYPDGETEKLKMEILVTEIFMALGVSEKNNTVLREFASEWGFDYKFSENNLYSLADQLHNRIQHHARVLHDLRTQINYIYPSEYKDTSDLDDESVKVFSQMRNKLYECVAIADNHLAKFAEFINSKNSKSKASLMFGMFRMLNRLYFNHPSNEWEYPNIEIF